MDGLWLDEVLATRRGHAVMIAAVAAELGRRAGWEVSVCSTPTAWYAGLLDDSVLWLIDPTGAADGVPTMVRRHCAHELAYVVLTGLAERFDEPARSRPGAGAARPARAVRGARAPRRRAARRALERQLAPLVRLPRPPG